MSREMTQRTQLIPVRTVDFSGWNDGWTSTRVAPTRNAPFAGIGALPGPSGPCTANQSTAEKLTQDWVAFWDEVALYAALSKTTKDMIWKAFQAEQDWFDNGFASGGIWCGKKEDLDAFTASLAQMRGVFDQERSSRNLVKGAAVTSTPTPVKTIAEEHITAPPNYWGLTVGVAAVALAAVVAARGKSRGELESITVRNQARRRRRQGRPRRG